MASGFFFFSPTVQFYPVCSFFSLASLALFPSLCVRVCESHLLCLSTPLVVTLALLNETPHRSLPAHSALAKPTHCAISALIARYPVLQSDHWNPATRLSFVAVEHADGQAAADAGRAWRCHHCHAVQHAGWPHCCLGLARHDHPRLARRHCRAPGCPAGSHGCGVLYRLFARRLAAGLRLCGLHAATLECCGWQGSPFLPGAQEEHQRLCVSP